MVEAKCNIEGEKPVVCMELLSSSFLSFSSSENKNAYRHGIQIWDYMFGVTGKYIYLTASLGGDSRTGKVQSKIKAAQNFQKYILGLTFFEILLISFLGMVPSVVILSNLFVR